MVMAMPWVDIAPEMSSGTAVKANQVPSAGACAALSLGHKLQEHRHRVLLAAVLVGRNPRHHPISPLQASTRRVAIDYAIAVNTMTIHHLRRRHLHCHHHCRITIAVITLRDRFCHCHPDCKPCNHGRHQRRKIISITRHQRHPQPKTTT